MESDPESRGWGAVNPGRFWIGAALLVMLVIGVGALLRAHYGVPFSSVEVWWTFMEISGVVAPIHVGWWFLRRGREAGRQLRAELGHDAVRLHCDKARCLGQASRARWTRGLGALVMTDDELRFRPSNGAEDIVIAVADLRTIDATRQHLGSPSRQDLVHVAFAQGDDEDTIAWEVEDPDAWLDALRARVPG